MMRWWHAIGGAIQRARIGALVAALVAGSVGGLGVLACAGCSGASKGGSAPLDTRRAEGLTYNQIVTRWNERAALLERVWARAAVSLSWKDEHGRSRYEQGRGHLQMVQPGQLALSVYKLGEVLFWFGADAERYWLIDRSDPPSARYGRHGRLTFERMRAFELPATPMDVAAMTGALPLPELSMMNAPVLYRSDDVVRGGVRFELRQGWRTLRYFVDTEQMVPRRVELLDQNGRVVVVAEQEAYGGVDVAGHGGIRPLFPSRIRVHHQETGATLTLSLEGMASRSPAGAIAPDAFDFASLVQRFGPMAIHDLDAQFDQAMREHLESMDSLESAENAASD
jgi:hypothetical protein